MLRMRPYLGGLTVLEHINVSTPEYYLACSSEVHYERYHKRLGSIVPANTTQTCLQNLREMSKITNVYWR